VVGYLGFIEITPAVPPTITRQPVNLAIPEGETNSLSVVAEGPGPLAYQWFKLVTGGQQALVGQTNDTLVFAPASAADTGSYFVEVRNNAGTTRSDIVTVTVTGPRPQITQPLQRLWLQPGQNLLLQVAATSSNGPLTYRWYRGTTLLQTGGTTYQRTGVSLGHAGLYRVEVSDPYYTVTSEVRVVVAYVLYTVTWLPSFEPGGSASPESINNSGVVAGYAGGPTGGVAVTVWTNGSPVRLTPPGAPFSWSWSLNEAGDVVGIQFGTAPGYQEGDGNSVRIWSPPYSPTNFTDLGTPAGHPYTDWAFINDRGEIVATDRTSGLFGEARFSFRHTAAGGWEPLGPLAGTTPLDNAVEQGWSTVLGINNAGVIVGLTYFQETNSLPTQATGWTFDPAVWPARRTAMDTLDPRLALSPGERWGWLDAVNDRGDVVGRRWGTNGSTKLFLVLAGGGVHELLSRPTRNGFGDSFNVDAMNNRREMVGFSSTSEGARAVLVRDRSAPPGGEPTSFDNFELYDLNELVVGGTGNFVLLYARDINDAGQIVGEAAPTDGSEDRPGFLLTPIAPYPSLSAVGVDDLLERPAGQPVEFSAQTLLANDLGDSPLSVLNVAATSEAGGSITDLGGGNYRYDPPPGPGAPDSFTYTLQAGDGSRAVGTVRLRIAPPPLPAWDGSLIQTLPTGQMRLHFRGTPGDRYRIEAAPDLSGPWVKIATFIVGPSGEIQYIDTPPLGLTARFYRAVRE
jgi:hypothetical protein